MVATTIMFLFNATGVYTERINHYQPSIAAQLTLTKTVSCSQRGIIIIHTESTQ